MYVCMYVCMYVYIHILHSHHAQREKKKNSLLPFPKPFILAEKKRSATIVDCRQNQPFLLLIYSIPLHCQTVKRSRSPIILIIHAGGYRFVYLLSYDTYLHRLSLQSVFLFPTSKTFATLPPPSPLHHISKSK